MKPRALVIAWALTAVAANTDIPSLRAEIATPREQKLFQPILKLEPDTNGSVLKSITYVPNGCYSAGQSSIGLPAGVVSTPETLSVKLELNYAKGKHCTQLVQPVIHKLAVEVGGKNTITAYTIYEKKVKGSASIPVKPNANMMSEGGGGGEIPTPFFISIDAKEAIGYSSAFSFEEAFSSAASAVLKNVKDHYPDELSRVEVVGAGAEYGGFSGVSRLYVRVRLLRLSPR